MTRQGRAAGALVIAGAVLYASWVLQFLLPSPLSPWTSYASELAAQGQPHAGVYRAADVAAGLLFVAGGLAARRRAGRGASRRARLLPWLVVVFGLATAADGLSPMSCTPTVDAACAAREAAGEVPLGHLLHDVTSTVAGAAFWAALVVVTWGRPGRSRMAWLLLVLAVAWTVATAWTLVAQVPGVQHGLLGLAQRLELALTTCWLVAYGIAGLRSSRRRAAGRGAGDERDDPTGAGRLTGAAGAPRA